jgi:hypothetical protein
MAALEGFELVESGGDAVVSEGLLNGDAVAGGTLDATGLDEGNALVVVREDALAIINEADLDADDAVVGSASISGAEAVTAVSLAGRGSDLAASSDE